MIWVQRRAFFDVMPFCFYISNGDPPLAAEMLNPPILPPVDGVLSYVYSKLVLSIMRPTGNGGGGGKLNPGF